MCNTIGTERFLAETNLMHTIKIKRIYDDPADDDGYRMLVNRLWPRGIKKELALLDEWNKEIAPSTELRKWFAHKSEYFDAFSKCYKQELRTKRKEITRVRSIAKTKNLTLLYAAKEENFNHAKILLLVLKQHRKA